MMKQNYTQWVMSHTKHVMSTIIGLIGILFAILFMFYVFIVDQGNGETLWQANIVNVQVTLFTIVGMIIFWGFGIGMLYQPYSIWLKIIKPQLSLRSNPIFGVNGECIGESGSGPILSEEEIEEAHNGPISDRGILSGDLPDEKLAEGPNQMGENHEPPAAGVEINGEIRHEGELPLKTSDENGQINCKCGPAESCSSCIPEEDLAEFKGLRQAMIGEGKLPEGNVGDAAELLKAIADETPQEVMDAVDKENVEAKEESEQKEAADKGAEANDQEVKAEVDEEEARIKAIDEQNKADSLFYTKKRNEILAIFQAVDNVNVRNILIRNFEMHSLTLNNMDCPEQYTLASAVNDGFSFVATAESKFWCSFVVYCSTSTPWSAYLKAKKESR